MIIMNLMLQTVTRMQRIPVAFAPRPCLPIIRQRSQAERRQSRQSVIRALLPKPWSRIRSTTFLNPNTKSLTCLKKTLLPLPMQQLIMRPQRRKRLKRSRRHLLLILSLSSRMKIPSLRSIRIFMQMLITRKMRIESRLVIPRKKRKMLKTQISNSILQTMMRTVMRMA